MVTIHDVSTDDILECKFYLISIENDVQIALDVDLISEEYSVIKGTVKIVENMPFDALEGKRIKLNIEDDKVYFDSGYGNIAGADIKLISV